MPTEEVTKYVNVFSLSVLRQGVFMYGFTLIAFTGFTETIKEVRNGKNRIKTAYS